jgi:acetoin utilization deacetylase AcuC-like enzyme
MTILLNPHDVIFSSGMVASLVITGDIFSLHDCRGHPESQIRLRQALEGVPPGVLREAPEPAVYRDLCRVHNPWYIRKIEEAATSCPEGRCLYLDSDTYVTRHSYEVACLAAGGAVQAALHSLKHEPGFALVRPPGHHAGRTYAMGFCLFNNAAVAAAAVLERTGRVAIIDWDVHHGNGTQDIFYDSDRVLYCSVHQSPWFPGTGYRDETGRGVGQGFTLNVPLPQGSGVNDYRRVFTGDILPAVRDFDPDLLIISAGQDCLWDDPLGGMELRPEDFGELTGLLQNTGIPVSFVLEGGYSPSHPAAIGAIFDSLLNN